MQLPITSMHACCQKSRTQLVRCIASISLHASHHRHRCTRIAARSMHVAYHPAHSSMHGTPTDGTCHYYMYHGQHTHKYVVHHLMSRASHVCTSQPHSGEMCTLLHAASINIALAAHTCNTHSSGSIMPSLVSQHTCCALREHTLAAPSVSLPTTNRQPFAGLEALSAYCVLTAPVHQPRLPSAAAVHPLSLEVSPISLTSSSTIPHRDLGSNTCTKEPILSGHRWILLDLLSCQQPVVTHSVQLSLCS
jgi:hypothetical protein